MVSITAHLTSLFQKDDFTFYLEKNKAIKKDTTDQYVTAAWKIEGLTVILYKQKIVIQGSESEYSIRIIGEVCAFDGISLDAKNRNVLNSLIPLKHNAILCENCNKTSHLIRATLKELQIIFVRECNHSSDLNHPITMINNRLLPDISILVSQSLSRLIELNHFQGFEIIIPDFLMNVVDNIGSKKKSISTEIEKIISLESKKCITIKNYANSLISFELEKIKLEDDYLISFSDITNSILITSDENMRTKAILQKRPVIYISPDIHMDIKTIHQTRI